MSTPSSFNRDSFQQFLVSAYAVKQSGIDTQSLAALLELQQSLVACAPDADRAMQLIVSCAQHVAHASGVAIALMTGDQLVYRAGSGCATSYVGSRMTAVLSVSASDQPRSEILRVEDAQTDGRIVAEICRQFEMQALLILPVYHEHAVAGVLEILFSDPHAFGESELRAYRMMAAMVEDQMFKARPKAQRSTVLHAIGQITSQFSNDDLPTPAPRMTYPVIAKLRILPPKFHLNAAVTGVIAALVIAACWIIYEHRPVSPVNASARQESTLPAPDTAQQQQTAVRALTPAPTDRQSRGRTIADGKTPKDAPNPAFKRLWVGPNEVDYVTDDVTIRHFTTATPTRPQAHDSYREVQFGKDVTVRYFAARPTVAAQPRPVSDVVRTVEQSVPTAK